MISHQQKNLSLRRNSVAIALSQICNMGISFLIVPITLNILGATNYGVWITLMALIEWLSLFDFGFGHGLRNRFAESKAKNEFKDLQSYVSTTFFMLLIISIFILLITVPLNLFLNWAKILNAPLSLSKELNLLATFLCIIFCVRFVANIISTILTADQRPFIPALITLSGNLLSLIGLLVFKPYLNNSILNVGICLSLSQVIPLFISSILLFSKRYKKISPKFKYFSRIHLRDIFSLGLKFFLIQITNLVLYYSNNIIIAHLIGNEQVTEYNIAYKYINVINMIFAAFLIPYWSSFTDAYVKKEIQWINTTIKKINLMWVGISLLGVIAVLLSPFVYKIWIKNVIYPDFKLLFLILLYFIFTMRYSIYRTFMNGVGIIRLQFYVTFLEALLHIPVAILLSRFMGIYGMVITMLIWSLINSIWEPVQYKKIINDKATGLWKQ